MISIYSRGLAVLCLSCTAETQNHLGVQWDVKVNELPKH